MNGMRPVARRKAAFSAAPTELGRVVNLTVCLGQASRSIAAAGFAPRKAATTIYLVDGIGRYGAQLGRLGPHTTGVGCLYIKDLEKIDLSVLENIVAESYRTLTDGTYMLRAREGTPAPPAE
jgi:hypothetical protein